jgi:hypothetical protein
MSKHCIYVNIYYTYAYKYIYIYIHVFRLVTRVLRLSLGYSQFIPGPQVLQASTTNRHDESTTQRNLRRFVLSKKIGFFLGGEIEELNRIYTVFNHQTH